MSISVASIDRLFPSRSLVRKYGLCWGGGVTSRNPCRLVIGGGMFMAGGVLAGLRRFCSGVQCARHFVRMYSVLVILFGCTVCSSFCSVVQCARRFVRVYSVLVILFGCTVCSSFCSGVQCARHLSGCYWKIQYMCDIFLPC